MIPSSFWTYSCKPYCLPTAQHRWLYAGLHREWKGILGVEGTDNHLAVRQLESAVSLYLRKVCSVFNTEDIVQEVKKKLHTQYAEKGCATITQIFDVGAYLAYIEECVRVSWELCVQSPAMTLNSEMTSSLIKSFIWPTLLQSSGPTSSEVCATANQAEQTKIKKYSYLTSYVIWTFLQGATWILNPSGVLCLVTSGKEQGPSPKPTSFDKGSVSLTTGSFNIDGHTSDDMSPKKSLTSLCLCIARPPFLQFISYCQLHILHSMKSGQKKDVSAYCITIPKFNWRHVKVLVVVLTKLRDVEVLNLMDIGPRNIDTMIVQGHSSQRRHCQETNVKDLEAAYKRCTAAPSKGGTCLASLPSLHEKWGAFKMEAICAHASCKGAPSAPCSAALLRGATEEGLGRMDIICFETKGHTQKQLCAIKHHEKVLLSGVVHAWKTSWSSKDVARPLQSCAEGQGEQNEGFVGFCKHIEKRCLVSWLSYHHMCIRRKLLKRQSTWFHNVRLLSSSYSLWRVELMHAVVMRQKSKLSLWYWSHTLQRKALLAWLWYGVRRRRKAERYSIAMETYRSRLLIAGVRCWIQYATTMQDQRLKEVLLLQTQGAQATMHCVKRCCALEGGM
eukprot:Em0013g6a